MKTSWIIFIGMVYLAILYFSGIMEQTNNINSSVASNFMALNTPSGTNFMGVLATDIVNVWNYLLHFFPMLFLWNPSIWTGYWLYFYYIFCIPICIGMVMSIVFILRGVHNS